MLPGPVFERELMTTARRTRFFALRLAYGVVMLGLVASACRELPSGGGPEATVAPAVVRQAARDLFRTLLLAQGLAVVFLTPALTAGAIAGEVQRKTLHDLLTSDLTSAEIVLGKLGARLLHVVVLVAVGLPFLVFTGLLGGLGLGITAAAVATMLSTAFFLGALSLLASTQTRSVRGALNFTFTLALTWLILPGAVVVHLPRGGGLGFRLYEVLGPLNAWIAASTPFTLLIELLGRTIRGTDVLLERLAWMVGLQVVYGALLAGLAIVALRPSYRNRQGWSRSRRRRSVPRVVTASEKRRHAAARPCGDDAMLWKELFAPRTPAFYRPLGLLVAAVLGSLLVWTTFDFAAPAFAELLRSGYRAAPSGSARGVFQFYLRIVGTGVYLVYVLGVASDAAAGLASEREKDTWISLIATPLTGTEIIRAKMLGAIWGIRHTAVALVGLWVVGLLAGSIHPLGIAALVLELVAFTWFAAALGTWFSLRSDQTMRAAARVVGCLVVVNIVPLLMVRVVSPGQALGLVGCTPLLMAASVVSHGEVAGTFAPSTLGLFSDALLSRYWIEQRGEMLLTCLLSVASYAAGAWLLTRSACRGFDALLDRPHLSEAEPANVAPDVKSPRFRGRAKRARSAECRPVG